MLVYSLAYDLLYADEELMWDKGTNMYFGGEAFVLILNSIFPSFLAMKNTLPER